MTDNHIIMLVYLISIILKCIPLRFTYVKIVANNFAAACPVIQNIPFNNCMIVAQLLINTILDIIEYNCGKIVNDRCTIMYDYDAHNDQCIIVTSGGVRDLLKSSPAVKHFHITNIY